MGRPYLFVCTLWGRVLNPPGFSANHLPNIVGRFQTCPYTDIYFCFFARSSRQEQRNKIPTPTQMALVSRGVGGHVVNVASLSAFIPSETLSAYTTSKYAVLGLSEALRNELHRHRIGVTAVCPGMINTPLTSTSQMRGAAGTQGERERMVQLYERRNYSPERVARNLLKAIQRNRAVAPISPESWFIYYLKRLAPGAVRVLGRRFMSPPHRPAGTG